MASRADCIQSNLLLLAITYQPVRRLECLHRESRNIIMKGERTMTRMTVSRRKLFATGACVLAGAVALPGERASALSGQNSANEEIVRRWYAAWGNKDLGSFNALLADNFTFT